MTEEGSAAAHPFPDLPPLSAARFASIEDRAARLPSTERNVVIMQGEALLPLEGAARGCTGPGTTALNMITGPCGQTLGNWLRDRKTIRVNHYGADATREAVRASLAAPGAAPRASGITVDPAAARQAAAGARPQD